MTDSEALQRYVQFGDAEAFCELVHQYQRLVYAACRRHLREPADIEDATQETFLRLARRAGEIQSSIAGWLHTCAVRVSLDLIREDASRRRVESKAAQAIGRDEPGWIELSGELDQALASLDEADRTLILRRFYEQTTQTALAQEAGVSEATMHRRVQASVEKLRQALAARGVTHAATLGATGLAGLLAADAAAATVPAQVTAAATQAGLIGAGAGATGAVGAAKVKLAAVVLAGLALLAGAISYLATPPAVTTPTPPPAPVLATFQPTVSGPIDPDFVSTRWRGTLTRDGQTQPAWLATTLGEYFLAREGETEATFGPLSFESFDADAATNVVRLTASGQPGDRGPRPVLQARYAIVDGSLRMAIAPADQPAPATTEPADGQADVGVSYLQMTATDEPLVFIEPYIDRDPDSGGYSWQATGQGPLEAFVFQAVGFGRFLSTVHDLEHPERMRDVVGLFNHDHGYVGGVFAEDAGAALLAWMHEQAPFRAEKVARTGPVYRLVYREGAARPLEPATSPGGWSRSGGGAPDRTEVWDGYTADALAHDLEWRLDRPVLNDTGLDGRYRFEVPGDIYYEGDTEEREQRWRALFEPWGLHLVADEAPVEYLEILPADPALGPRELMQGHWIDGDQMITVSGDRITMAHQGREMVAVRILELDPDEDDRFSGTLRLQIDRAPREDMVGLESIGRYRYENGGLTLAMGRPGLKRMPDNFEQSREVNVMRLRRLAPDGLAIPANLRGTWTPTAPAADVSATFTEHELHLTDHGATRRFRLIGQAGHGRGSAEWVELDADDPAAGAPPFDPAQVILGELSSYGGGELGLAVGRQGQRRAHARYGDDSADMYRRAP